MSSKSMIVQNRYENRIRSDIFMRDFITLPGFVLDEIRKEISPDSIVYCDHVTKKMPCFDAPGLYYLVHPEEKRCLPSHFPKDTEVIETNSSDFKIVSLDDDFYNDPCVHLLDRMSGGCEFESRSSFVGVFQKDGYTESFRRKYAAIARNITIKFPNFRRGSAEHIHDGYSSMGGEHNAYRKNFGPYRCRQKGSNIDISLSDKISKHLDKSMNLMMRPLWSVGKFYHNPYNYDVKGWSELPIGKAYLCLFPQSVTHKKRKRSAGGLFSNSLFTIGFSSMYHIDHRDGNSMSHCIFMPPAHWQNGKNYEHPRQCFLIADKLLDISKFSSRLSWFSGQCYHATTKPYDCPLIPTVLNGSRNEGMVAQHRNDIDEFVNSSPLAWGSWSTWKGNISREEEWKKARNVNGVIASEYDPEVKERRRILLLNWLSIDSQG